MGHKIGVIADTATDTAMGKAFLERHGCETVCRPVKETAAACVEFFKEPPFDRERYVAGLIEEIKAEGGEAVCVYANSVCVYEERLRLPYLKLHPFPVFEERAGILRPRPGYRPGRRYVGPAGGSPGLNQ